MPGLVPGIHVLIEYSDRKTWMAGTSPAMTGRIICSFDPQIEQAIQAKLPLHIIDPVRRDLRLELFERGGRGGAVDEVFLLRQ
jgi:hypothetical protein